MDRVCPKFSAVVRSGRLGELQGESIFGSKYVLWAIQYCFSTHARLGDIIYCFQCSIRTSCAFKIIKLKVLIMQNIQNRNPP